MSKMLKLLTATASNVCMTDARLGGSRPCAPPPILVYDCGSFGGLHDTHNSAISFRNVDCRSDMLQLGHEMSDVSIQCNIH